MVAVATPPKGRTDRARAEMIAALDHSRQEELDELNARHRPARRQSLIAAWLGGWQRPAARAVAEPLPDVRPGELGVSFAGHATVMLRWARAALVCDPMLGGRIGVVKRAVQPGLSPAEMGDVDLILVTHSHPDHLDPRTLAQLPRKATIVVPPRCAELVSPIGFARVVELAVDQSFAHAGLEVVSTPARHPVRGNRGACSWVIRGDGPSVFFCGDSGYFSGFAEIGRRHRPDLAFLPIAGYVPRSFRARHLSPLDALYAFEDLGARMLVPIHYGTFPMSYETLDEPLAWFERLVAERGLGPHVTVLPAGASRKFARP